VSGHSKWAQIKRKKAATDSRRGRLWTRLMKEITVACRLGGGDPAGNPRLRTAILDAKAANVPNENIDRAIKRGSGEADGAQLEEIAYEGYGPGGGAVFIEAITDNRNRTVAEVRHLFTRHGGNLGESGCVAWMFQKRGYFAFDRSGMDEESFLELALELEVDDLRTDDPEAFELYTAADDFERVREALEERSLVPAVQELSMIPSSTVELPAGKASQALRLMEALEEHDDVQHVWANFELNPEAAMVQAD
jgi:YebC/PmpR family DNA-binding regulatory protein